MGESLDEGSEWQEASLQTQQTYHTALYQQAKQPS